MENKNLNIDSNTKEIIKNNSPIIPTTHPTSIRSEQKIIKENDTTLNGIIINPNSATMPIWKKDMELLEKISKEEVDAIVQYLMSRYKLYEDVDDGKWHGYSFENEETYGSLILVYSEKYQKCNIDIFGEFAK